MVFLTWLQHPYTVTLVRWLLAVMFLISSIGKLLDRRRFTDIVLAYQVLPKHLAVVFALFLPWLEAAVGLMLLLGLTTKVGAILSGLLLLSFAMAVGVNLMRRRTELDCGCFSLQRRQKISSRVLVRNIVLMMLSIQVALFTNGYFALDGKLFGLQETTTEGPSTEGLLLTLLISIGVLMIYLLFRQAMAFSRHYHS